MWSVALAGLALAQEVALPAALPDEQVAAAVALEPVVEPESVVDPVHVVDPEPVEPATLPLDLDAHLHGYAAAGASIYGSAPLGFSLGDLIMAYDANLDGYATFQGEISYELREQNSMPMDVEVLDIAVRPNPNVAIHVGRFRNPMTPWSELGLHGSYRYTALAPPEILTVEHQGGLLPIHLVGVWGAARKDLGFWSTGADIAVTNGRSSWLSSIPQGGDTGWFKAVLTRVWLRSPDGVTVSVGGYVDRIAAATQVEEGTPVDLGLALDTIVDEQILSLTLVSQAPHLELLGEGYAIWHTASGQTTLDSGGYLQAGWRARSVMPYVRAEYIDSRPSDPVAALFDRARFEGKGSLGLRWDLALHAAVKFQVDVLSEQYRPVVGAPEPFYTKGGGHLELSAGF